jgi:hypothetical protein
MWLYVTHDRHEATAVVEELLAPALDRDPRTLADHLPIGPPARCTEILSAYADAGAKRVLLWPVRDGTRQLQACAEEVLPHLPDGRAQGREIPDGGFPSSDTRPVGWCDGGSGCGVSPTVTKHDRSTREGRS